MSTIVSTPGLMRVLTASVIARLPVAMLGIGLLVHAEHLTGSFAAAGAVAAAYAAATGIGGPLLGRVVDRRGQTGVLSGGALVSSLLLFAVATLPAGTGLPSLLTLAAGVGIAAPPVGACLRALLPSVVAEAETLRVAYAVDATVVELTWVFGPPLVLGVGAVTSTGVAIAAAGAVLLAGTAAFAAEPASRGWRPTTGERRPRGGSLDAPGVRKIVSALVAVGVVLGAAEVGVAAAAETLAGTAAASPLLEVWGAGSLVGGVLATRLGGGADNPAGLALVLAALAVGHVSLAAAAGSLVALALTLFAAGAAIAPVYASVYAMVERLAPAGTATEAFAWLTTAAAIGTATGSAGAGALVEAAGPVAAFVFAGVAGAVAVLVTMLRVGTLAGTPARVAVAAA
jgi:MFS family permease